LKARSVEYRGLGTNLSRSKDIETKNVPILLYIKYKVDGPDNHIYYVYAW